MDDSTLFSTVTQVSFTITGLLVIALANETKLREYWFHHPARRFFANLNFIALFTPGLAALFGLILPVNEGWTPAWPLSFFIFGGINLTFTLIAWHRKRQHKGNNEFRKLCDSYWNVHRDLFIDALLFLSTSVIGFFFYFINNLTLFNPEMIAGVALCASIFTGSFNVLLLFKPHPEDEKPAVEPVQQKPIEPKTVHRNSSFQPLVIAITLLFALPVYLFINRGKRD